MKTTFLMAAMITGFMLPAIDAQAQGRGERPDFATLDTNGDGALTMEELAAAGAARFATADTDGDGLLSAAELTAQATERAEGRAAEAVARMLEHLDENGDGNISQDELPDRGDRAERMFERADANDDGTVTQEEFQEARPERGGRHGDGERGGEGRGPRGRG